MTTSIKKEISSLIEEVLKELGQVDHRVPGTGPIHTGFSELPISSTALEHLNHKVEEAYNLVEKALENLDQVVAEMESNGHHPGDLLLIADQAELVADGLAKHIGIGTDDGANNDLEKELDEAKSRKRKKCRCADGKKLTKCCRKRLRKPRHYYWYGYGLPFRRFYGGHHHHHHFPLPPPPPETPSEEPTGGGSGEPAPTT